MVTILLVEDSATVRVAFAAQIERQVSAEIVGASDLAHARDVLRTRQVDVVFLDLMLGHEAGLDLLDDLESRARTIIMTSLEHSDPDVRRGTRSGVRAYLRKPVKDRELRRALEFVGVVPDRDGTDLPPMRTT